jgi:hypothetical protein
MPRLWDVLAAGQETIDGVPTTRYHGHFALDDALAALDTHQRAEMRSLWQTPGGSGPLNFTAWIDGHHLIRRIIMTTPDEAKKGLTATIDYAAFDVPVDITAPPAEQAHGKLTGDDLHVPA